MPVVINDFEVMPADTTAGPTANSSASTSADRKTPSPHEVELMIEQQCERAERVRAH